MTSPQSPALSVVVAIVSDTTSARAGVGPLTGCLEALARQKDAPPMEVIVPVHANVDGIEEVRQRFPEVVYVPVDGLEIEESSREHHDVIRARGLAAAQGQVNGLLEDHARPDERWCANALAAHAEDYAVVGGAIENGIDRALNWAVYFCDFGKYQNPLPPGESASASDANSSYKRAALESIRSTWERSFREIVVNETLKSRGEKLALRPDIVVYQHRDGLRLGPALHERFIWGRSYAASRNAMMSNFKRLIYAALSPALPVLLMARIGQTAWQRRRNFPAYLRSAHYVAILLASWSLGECVGYLRGVGSGRETAPS